MIPRNIIIRLPKYSTSYGGVDALKRTLPLEGSVSEPKSEKYVGLFLFLHGWVLMAPRFTIIRKLSTLTRMHCGTRAEWGNVGTFHFWGEPLFGYYVSSDQWVMRKHVQMLSDADVDFLVFDTTNASGGPTTQAITNSGGGNNTYVANALAMLKILDEYYKAGWNVHRWRFIRIRIQEGQWMFYIMKYTRAIQSILICGSNGKGSR